ncbi:MAG: hypothetical protein JWN84_919 [Nocardioides sp.]|nr:hypothetical protein [Nocardioides sp.]
MNVRTAMPLALALVVAAGATAPVLAAPKPKPKPITASYDLTLLPVPLPLAGSGAPLDGANSCVSPELEGVSTDTRSIKTSGPGTLVVDVSGFAGDWDITVLSGGRVLGIGSGTTTGGEASGGDGSLGTDNAEKAVVKVKRASQLQIAVCNFAGGPDASAKYTFTYG